MAQIMKYNLLGYSFLGHLCDYIVRYYTTTFGLGAAEGGESSGSRTACVVTARQAVEGAHAGPRRLCGGGSKARHGEGGVDGATTVGAEGNGGRGDEHGRRYDGGCGGGGDGATAGAQRVHAPGLRWADTSEGCRQEATSKWPRRR